MRPATQRPGESASCLRHLAGAALSRPPLTAPHRRGLYRFAARILCVAMVLGGIPTPALAEITRQVTLAPGWHLVSIPLGPTNSGPESVFAGLPSPRRIYDYVAGQTLGLLEAGFRNVRAGWAHKILVETPLTITVTGQPITTNQTYSVPITPGWNAIGSPWLVALAWSDARVSVRRTSTNTTLLLSQAVTSGWVEAGVRALDPSTDTYTTILANIPGAELAPWRGYEIFSTITGDLILQPPPLDPNPPLISPLSSPLDGSVVTQPTDIIGSIQDAELAEWRVEIGRPGAPTASYRIIGTGTAEVTNGTLATLDPTMLRNGLYIIRVVATDIFGRTTTLSSSVVVKDRMKVGAFSVAFTDLEVPVAGLPIRVTRTYDTRDSAVRGDWGNGWSLDVSQAKVHTSVTPGAGWSTSVSGGLFPSYCLSPSRAHVVTVTLPDDTVLEFDASPNPTCQTLAPLAATTMIFAPRPGTLATLQALGGADLLVVATGWPGTAELTTFSGNTFDPAAYVVKMQDGREFTISRTQGLLSIKDLNGNQLTYSSSGITHNSGQGIAIGRDGTGRILSITDPMGESLIYGYNLEGDLETVRDREGNVTTMTYLEEPEHFLDEIHDPLGRTPIKNTYYPDGRIQSHTDAYGHTIQYSRNLAARQETVTDRNGGLRVLDYDARGNVIHETDPLGRTTTRTFDTRNNRLTETDPNGATTVWTYDASDNIISTTDPLGNLTSQTYNPRRQVLTSTDPRGRTTANVYDAKGNLTQTTDADAKVATYSYDTRGNLLTQTQTVGGTPETTTNTYDGFGNLTSEIDANGNVTKQTYDAAGNRISETRTRTLPGGGAETLTTSYFYDRNGRLVKTTDPDGSFTETSYDAAGRQATTTDKLGRTTTYEYDLLGRLIKTTFSDATFDESTYDAEGRRLTSKDRGGRVMSYEYDAVGRLLTTVIASPPLAGEAISANTYDAAGRLASTTDGRGKTTTYDYDAAGRRTKVTDPLGHVTQFTYDGNGNQLTVKDALNHVTTYEYDNLNRRTKTIFPDSTFTQTTYDEAGRRTSERDQAGKVTQFQYDKLGRLTKVTDALNQETEYTYDEIGNRLTQTDANGRTTAFEYDQLGREVARILPDGARETKTYDVLGNLSARTDFLGRATSYSYDINNRLTSRGAACSSCEKADAAWTYTPTGRRATAAYQIPGAFPGAPETITETYAYDVRDRISSVATVIASGGAPATLRSNLSYTYDANSNRKTMMSVVGGVTTTASYAYDDASRLDMVTDALGRAYDLSYDAVGNRTGLAYPNGAQTTYAYNTLNRLTNLSTLVGATPIQSYTFTLGPAGNRTQIVELDKTKVYTYDDLYRLTGEQVIGGAAYSKAFGYDAVGNRLSQMTAGSAGSAVTPGVTAYAYDTRDRLLTENSTSYTYDANGNVLTKSGDATYTWDTENRLVRIAKADGTLIEHAYDPDGARIRTKTTLPASPTQTTNFLVDTSGGLSHVVAEFNLAGSQTAYYLRALDDLLAVIRPTDTRYFHADGIGSIRKLTDETGTVTDSYEYTAFGEQYEHVGMDPQPYSFAGEPLDPDTGFQYHRARWMQPSTGRFAGMDAWQGEVYDPFTLHRYAYAGNSPATLIDRTGLSAASVLGTHIHTHIRSMYPGALLRGAIPGFPAFLFPDLADLATKEVMEIKPLSVGGLAGWFQLQGYILALNYVGARLPFIGTGWRAGQWSPVPGEYLEPITKTPYFILGNASGVIFYAAPPQRSRERVLQRIRVRVPTFQVSPQVSVERIGQLVNEIGSMQVSDETVRLATIAGTAALVGGAMIGLAMSTATLTARFGF